MDITKLDAFTAAYLECALWASMDDDGEPLEQAIIDIAPATFTAMVKECRDFQAANAALLARWYEEGGQTEDGAGHDFWLTRNHHGAGFWDRFSKGTPGREIGEALTDAAQACGERDLYVGDDGQVHQGGE